jgi:hypothetical protein
VKDVCDEHCPLPKTKHLCTQTETGLSARTFETILTFSKAVAWFRGNTSVSWVDVKQILPWVTRDKLQMNAESPFFESAENEDLKRDKAAWIRNLVEMSDEIWEESGVKEGRKTVHRESKELLQALKNPGALTSAAVERKSEQILTMIRTLVTAEFSGWVYEDVLEFKRIYQGYRKLLRNMGLKK